jgi:hypothetical protein
VVTTVKRLNISIKSNFVQPLHGCETLLIITPSFTWGYSCLTLSEL